ncbi:MAG: glycerol-3-phosphate 1-O-acyltransferase PlsY [Pseudomonadota bacterium]
MSPFVIVGALVLAYLAGSIPTGLLVARLCGVDIRRVGSGNIGATNVARNLGKKIGIVVLLADMIKGFVPAAVARSFWRDVPGADWATAGVCLAAVLGHVFPVWLRFRGGKGVATVLGVSLAVAPLATGAALLAYVAMFAAFRISSIGSLSAATALPVAVAIQGESRAILVLAIALGLTIVLRHRENIRRLFRGEEGKL